MKNPLKEGDAPHSFDFMHAYVDIFAYAGWPNPNYLKIRSAYNPTETMRTFCRLVDEGNPFPHLRNFHESLRLTDQFLTDRVDVESLQDTIRGLREDILAVRPFDEAIPLEDSSLGFPNMVGTDSRPFKLLRGENFKNALRLLLFVAQHIDAGSGYCFMRPDERKELQDNIEDFMGSMVGISYGSLFPVPR